MVKQILILEDDMPLAMQWSRALSLERFQVHVTHSASDAVQVFEKNEIDLCVLDFMVHHDGKPAPEGGLTFMAKIGALGRKKTRILGVSGLSIANSALDAQEFLLTFGAEDFIGKPFSDSELIQKIHSMLED